MDSARAFDITGAKARLCVAAGGYETVHQSLRLQVYVYALVAPEPDHQRVNGARRDLHRPRRKRDARKSTESSSSFGKVTRHSSLPALTTLSAPMSTSPYSRSALGLTHPVSHGASINTRARTWPRPSQSAKPISPAALLQRQRKAGQVSSREWLMNSPAHLTRAQAREESEGRVCGRQKRFEGRRFCRSGPARTFESEATRQT